MTIVMWLCNCIHFFESQLTSDMKFTRIEELNVQLETAFKEVKRLQLMLMQRHEQPVPSTRPVTASKRLQPETGKRELISRVRMMSQVIKQLNDDKEELQAKNECLTKKIKQMINSSIQFSVHSK